jgi:TP901 family phage tail tape measure protein
MANVVNRNVNIFIESGQAQKAFDTLIKKEKELKDALAAATDPKQVAKLKDQLDKLAEPLDRAKRKVSGELQPSFRDVQATVNSLGNRLKRMSEEDADYTKVVAQYRQANSELDAQKGKVGLLGNAMKSFMQQAKTVAVGVIVGNTIQSALQTVLGYVTGIVTGSAKISDELADIQRITGLTKEEVRGINTELKKIDTRTSVSALRDIALVAGKLGIEGKQDIVSFVTAVDKLNVALGGELGDVNQFTTDLGKILNVFEGKITGENITAVGNAIVDLANKGVASGPFIVDFTQRVAGIAKTSNLSLGAVIGLAAGLEESGLKVESSSTAVSKLLVKIAEDVPKAAKIAGKDVKEFTELFANAPQEALLQFAQGLQKDKGSFAEIASSFKDAGEEGARVISTLTTLGQRTDFFRGKMTEAGRALKDTTSITDAFNIKNQTAGAELDKFKKNIAGLFTSSSFQGAGENAIKLINGFVNVIKSSIQFIKDHGGLIATLGAIYVVTTKSVEGATLANIKNAVVTRAKIVLAAIEKTAIAASVAAQLIYANIVDLVAKRVTLATAAQRIWNVVTSLGAGPIGILLVAVGGIAIGLQNLFSKTRQLTAEQKNQIEIAKRVNDATLEQRTKIDLLRRTIEQESNSLDTKKKALKELIDINPEFQKTLTLDEQGHLKGAEAIDKYVQGLKIKAGAEAKYSLLVDKLKQKTEDLNKLREQNPKLATLDDAAIEKELRAVAQKSVGIFSSAQQNIAVNTARGFIQQFDEIDKLQNDIANVDKNGKGPLLNLLLPPDVKKQIDAAGVSIDALKKKLEELQKERDATTDDKKRIGLNKDIEDTQKEIDRLEGKVQKLSTTEKKAVHDLSELIKEIQKIDEELQLVNVSDLQKDLLKVDQKYDALRVRAKGNNALLLEIERLYQIERGNIIDKYAKEAAEKAAKLDEEQKKRILDIALHANDALAAALSKANPDRDRLQKEFADFQEGKKTFNQRSHEDEDKALEPLNELHEKKLISEDEFETAVDKIHESHEADRWANSLAAFIKYLSFSLDLFNTYNQLKTDRENAELDADRRRNEAKRNNLDRRLKQGVLTQMQYNREINKIDNEQQQKEKEARKKQFERNKIANAAQAAIDGAGAEIKTMEIFGPPVPPNILGIIAFAATAAMTIAKITAIATQKAPEFGHGGLLHGPSHQDKSKGMPVTHPYTGKVVAYLEGKEGIVNKKTMGENKKYTLTGTPNQIVSKLNGLHGVEWTSGATMRPAWSTQRPVQMNFPAIKKYYAAGGQFAVTSNDASKAQDQVQVSTAMAAQLNDTLLLMHGTIADMQSTISDLQKNGIPAYTLLTDQEKQQNRLAAIRKDATLKG